MDNINFNELIDKAVDLLLPVLMSTGSYLFIMAKITKSMNSIKFCFARSSSHFIYLDTCP